MTEFFSLSLDANLFDKREFQYIIANTQMQNDEYDEHLTADMLIKEASIPSEIISTSILPFFITYDKSFDKSFKFLFKEKDIKRKWSEVKTNENLAVNTKKYREVLGMCFEVKVNDNKVDSLKWYYRRHPITKQLGFHTKVNIDTFPRGEHILKAKFIQHVDSLNSGSATIRTIPFWKE